MRIAHYELKWGNLIVDCLARQFSEKGGSKDERRKR